MCGKELSTKYTLSNHIRCIHRDVAEPDDNDQPRKCPSFVCTFSTMYSSELKRHIGKCPLIPIAQQWISERENWKFQSEQQILELRTKYDQQLHDLSKYSAEQKISSDLFISKLQAENDILRQELERAHKMNEQAINRPTTIAHNTTNNQQNVRITNYLTGNDVFTAQTHPQHVKSVLDKHFEAYFMDGQQGLARCLVEHIIKVDGKLILVCTDTSRKRFRFVNADGKLAEDMKARMLCNKLGEPVREICHDVFERVLAKLESDKRLKMSNGSGAFEIAFADKRREWAEQKFMEIRSFERDDDNTDFLNELAALLRNPEDDEGETCI